LKDLLEAKTPLQKEKIDAKYKTKYNNNQEVYDTLTYDDSASNTYLGFGYVNHQYRIELMLFVLLVLDVWWYWLTH
jgi:hypothetical protein